MGAQPEHRYKITELPAEFKDRALNAEGVVKGHKREDSVIKLLEKVLKDALEHHPEI